MSSRTVVLASPLRVLLLLLSLTIVLLLDSGSSTRCEATTTVARTTTAFTRSPLQRTRGGATAKDDGNRTVDTDTTDADANADDSPSETNVDNDADEDDDNDEEEKEGSITDETEGTTATATTTTTISPDDPEALFLETDESDEAVRDDDNDDDDDYDEEEDDDDDDETTTTDALDNVVITTHEERPVVDDADVLRARGRDLHDEGRFAEAADAYGAAADSFENDEDDAAATCRSHEALCALKAGDHERCVRACDSLIASSSSSAAVRARAHHRRARARLATGDGNGALEDARVAAFSGDRGAVSLYGRLMRGDDEDEDDDANNDGGTTDGGGGQRYNLWSTRNDGLLNNLSSSNDDSAGLPSGGLSDVAASLLSGKGDVGNVAGTLVSSLAKKIETPEAQKTVCDFLNNSASPERISTFAEMARVPLTSSQIDRLVRVAKNVTPSKLNRFVVLSRRAVAFARVARRIYKIVTKYKHLLVYAVALQWIKSAIHRPVVVKKR